MVEKVPEALFCDRRLQGSQVRHLGFPEYLDSSGHNPFGKARQGKTGAGWIRMCNGAAQIRIRREVLDPESFLSIPEEFLDRNLSFHASLIFSPEDRFPGSRPDDSPSTASGDVAKSGTIDRPSDRPLP